MINIILIIICVSAGLIISRLKILPDDSHKSINIWLLYIALPALGLRFVPEINWSINSIIPSIAPLIIWLCAMLFVSIYARFVNLSKETKVALLISTGIGNTAFLGIPMVTAYFGENNISNAIIFDQITFIMFSTIVVPLVIKTRTKQQISATFIVKKLFLFPSFLATLLALSISPFFDYSFLNPLLDKILVTLSPLALFSIGLQIKFNEWKYEAKNLIYGLTYKMLIAPLIIMLIVVLVKQNDIAAHISIFQASMPTHITGCILASQYNLNPRLCNLLVGFGILASFFTTAFWYFIGGMLI